LSRDPALTGRRFPRARVTRQWQILNHADLRLIEIDQVVALIARAIQQGGDLGDESLPLLRISAAEQLVRLLPRQLEPVQCPANGLAADAAAELLLHEANQTPQRPAWLYIGSDDGRTGRLAFCGANLLAKRSGDVRAKGGRPPVR
jgi:hypothetical protein